MKRFIGLSVLFSLMIAMSSCNDRLIVPLDQALNAAKGQNITVDAKTKIDILFVVDASGSMKKEQESLAENFDTFSEFIFEDLKNAVDYRIAVVSTGQADESDPFGVFPKDLGVFVNPSLGERTECQASTNQILSPNNLGCAITDAECQRTQLKAQFSCAAQVGIDGVGFERGLEAMRSALSCNGLNANYLGACCQFDQRSDSFVYDPLCRGQKNSNLPAPEFLRPDAFLVVVFITDEDDCSTFSDAGIDSPFATCSESYSSVTALLGSGNEAEKTAANALIYNTYSNPRYCSGQSPEACHAAECTDNDGRLLDPVDCYFKRCSIKLSTDERGRLDPSSKEACRRQAGKLAPVSFYHRFLMGLKERPNEQIIVANITSPGLLTPSGYRLNFSDNPPVVELCEKNEEYLTSNLDMCCPNGQCGAIPEPVSCPDMNGEAGDGYSAWRYIDLMSMFGENGLGCREGETSGCVNLCNPNLNDALFALRTKVISAVGEYCIAGRPACMVNDPATGESRPCVDVELDVASNYQVNLRQICELGPEENGDCGVVGTETPLNEGSDYNLILNDLTCASGIRVKLTSPPKAGSTTKIDFEQSEQIFDQ